MIVGDQDDPVDLENYFSRSFNNFEPQAEFSPKEIKPSFEVKKRSQRKKKEKNKINKSVNFDNYDDS